MKDWLTQLDPHIVLLIGLLVFMMVWAGKAQC